MTEPAATATRGLTDLTEREVGLFTHGGEAPMPGTGPPAPVSRPGPFGGRIGRRAWLLTAAALVAWSLWDAGLDPGEIVNPGGWNLLARFWRAALDPELSATFLRSTWDAALTTVAFAVLGTVMAVVIGVVFGVLTSETWWTRAGRGRGRRLRRPGGGAGVAAGWYAGRGLVGLPRGIHEATWGLFFVNILGNDPLVGVIAIGIPFGAITAKVYADLLDESAGAAYQALRAAGGSRLTSLLYGVFPLALPDLVSYAFYRLECSIRSAVILGMIGAGGLGFQLGLSFQSLNYSEMWTLLYALIAISAAADLWGSALRRRGSPTLRARVSVLAAAALMVLSFWKLGPDLGRLFASSTRSLLADVASAAWPPTLPDDGWAGLLRRAVETVQMSVLAIALGGSLAVAGAFVAARTGGSAVRRAGAAAARLLLLVTRAIPPPVWALLVLFVVYPGPLPGAVALGLYNFGILGRLMAEVVENVDPRPGAALEALGAPPFSTFAYSAAPLSASRFAGYALYRWEVAARETVVVGVVGAGGLGTLLESQRAAFDYSGMLATVLALVGVSLAVDLVSTAVRRSLR